MLLKQKQKLEAENHRSKLAAAIEANTYAIVSLEDQWNTDPILGNFEVSKATGKSCKY